MFFWIRLWTLILQRRFFDLILPCFKIGLSQICFSKIGLRAWVTDFFGSNCEHLFSKKMIFPCFKNRLSQFGYFEIWIEAMSKWFVWIKLWTSYSSKTFFWFDFPCFKIGLSQICFSKIGLKPWKMIFWIKLWTLFNNVFFNWMFRASKLDYLKFDMSKIGLWPWINNLSGSTVNMFFKKRFCIWFSLLQNWIISNLIFPKLDWGHE